MAAIGMMPPPFGVVPKFDGLVDLQPMLIILAGVTLSFATVLLLARIYTSVAITKELLLDDPLIVLAWGSSLAFTVGMFHTMPNGYGKHLWNIRATDIQGYMNFLAYLALTYIWTPSLTKLSMLALYRRINPSKMFHVCLYATAFTIVGYSVAFTIVFAGPCNPLAVGSGQCLNEAAIVQAAVNIISDVIIIALPIPMIHSLVMPMKQKLLVGLILGLGSAATIFSIIRVANVRAMATNPDFTYTQGSTTVWSLFEMNLGIACVCMTRLKPFLRKHLPRLISSFSSSGNEASKGPYHKQKKAHQSGGGGGSDLQPGRWRGYRNEEFVMTDVQGQDQDQGRRRSVERRSGHLFKSDDGCIMSTNIRVKNEIEVRYDDRPSVATKDGSTENILKGGI
ncbi:hypothetical protein PG990_005316 [Apiospora arundinis]|uniref:Puromycin-sensitive aminopeptidase n=1 Tax=Apiospora arundinis TaxID=335852 RepID=A0ABR2J8G2_9PEZI